MKLTSSTPLAAETGSAPLWSVLFNHRKGGVHPVRIGRKDGEPLSRAVIVASAKAYLSQNRNWLRGIYDVRPVDSENTGGHPPARGEAP